MKAAANALYDFLRFSQAAKILSEKVKPRSQGTLDTNNGSASADAPISLGTSTGAQLPVLSAAATASAVPEPAFPAASLAAIAGRKRSAEAAFDSTRTAKEPLIDANPRNSLTSTGTGGLPPIRNSSNFQQQDLNNILTSLQQVPNQRLQQLSAQLNVRRTLPLNSSIQELLGLYSNVRTAPPRNNLSSTRTSLVSDNSALSTMAQFLALREQEERNRRIASDSLLLSRLLQPAPAGTINQFGRSTLPTPFSLALLANPQQQLSSNNQNSNNNTAIRQHGPEDQENDRKQSS